MRKLFTTLLFLAIGMLSFTQSAKGQIYSNDFGTTTIGPGAASFTGTPSPIDANISSSVWTTGLAAGLVSFTGSSASPNKALGLSSVAGSTTITLTMNLNTCYVANITGVSLWRQRSTTGPTTMNISINGTIIASGITVPTSGAVVTASTDPLPLNNLTCPITVVLTLSGGTGGTFRLDDFALSGSITAATPPTLTVVAPAAVCSPSTVDITAATVQTVNNGTTTKYYTTNALAVAGGASDVSSPAAIATSGTYYIRSEFNPCCYTIQSVLVTINANPTLSLTPSCVGGVGTGVLTPSFTASTGGLPSYNPATLNNLANGTYTVTVTESGSGCTATANATISCVTPCPSVVTLYVDASIGASGNGQSWATAYKTLDEALAIAHCCSVIDTIKVAAGTYIPTKKPYSGCTEMTTTDTRDITFHLPDGLVLWGGYPAGGGVRNSTVNITTLSGDIGTAGDATDNAYHVVLASAATSGGVGVTVDGFSITGGNATTASTTTVNGNSISRNGGGGIYTYNGTNALTNNTLSGNSADGGGGIYTSYATNTIANNTLSGNSAGNGGGIYTSFATNTITNNTLSGNSATSNGGGIYTSYATNTIANNTLSGNSAGNGGGIYAQEDTNTFTNNTLLGNSAGNGGGIYLDADISGIANFTNNIFWGNQKGGSSIVAGADYYNNLAMVTVTFTNNLLQLAAGTYTGGNYSLGTASGNIFATDPLFVNAADIDGADNIHRTADDGLRLKPCSPAINVGTNTGVAATDILGATRIQQSTVDMGAYENKDLSGYILSTSILNANAECTDVSGFTHYVNTANEALLLSLNKNGNTIGSIGDGTFMVTSGGSGVSNLGTTGTPAPYATASNWHTMNRYWNVIPTTQPSSDINVRFYYRPADFTDVQTASDIAVETDMVFYKINGAGNPNPATAHSGAPVTPATAYNSVGYWEYYNGASASATNWLSGTYNGNKYAETVVASFSGGGGGAGSGTGGGALPVELLTFTGKNKGSFNLLEWATASETNNAGFEIERSADGGIFQKIGFVASKSKEANTYTFKDETLSKNIFYYRLKQIDTDGKHTYSPVIFIKIKGSTRIIIYPNPSEDGIFRIEGKTITDQTLSVMNAVGQQVGGTIHQNEIDLRHLPTGIYYLNLEGESFKLVKE